MRSARPVRRLPPNHRIVYDVVRLQPPGRHAPAGDILRCARAIKPGLGHSTVYRALARLCASGLILEVRVPGVAGALYEPARAGHAHFLCRTCGALEDLDCDLPAGALAAALARMGGEAEQISVTVHGRCADCLGLHAEGAGRQS